MWNDFDVEAKGWVMVMIAADTISSCLMAELFGNDDGFELHRLYSS